MVRFGPQNGNVRQLALSFVDQPTGRHGRSSNYTSRGIVFLAFYPPPDIAEQIDGWAWYLHDKERLTGCPLGAARYHVTQLYLGQYAQLTRTDVAAIDGAVTSIGMSPFPVVFDLAERFRARRGPIVLVGGEGVEGLKMFHYDLVEALRQFGLTYQSDPHYNPHISLIYEEGEFRTQAVEEIRWTVHECVLVRSLQGEGRHIPLARWPLRG